MIQNILTSCFFQLSKQQNNLLLILMDQAKTTKINDSVKNRQINLNPIYIIYIPLFMQPPPRSFFLMIQNVSTSSFFQLFKEQITYF